MPFQSEIIYVHEMSATIKVGLTLITSCNLHVKLSLIEVDILVFRYRTPTHKHTLLSININDCGSSTCE